VADLAGPEENSGIAGLLHRLVPSWSARARTGSQLDKKPRNSRLFSSGPPGPPHIFLLRPMRNGKQSQRNGKQTYFSLSPKKVCADYHTPEVLPGFRLSCFHLRGRMSYRFHDSQISVDECSFCPCPFQMSFVFASEFGHALDGNVARCTSRIAL